MFRFDDDFHELKVKYFYSKLRSGLFKKIANKKDGATQWRLITGKKNRHKGSLIFLNDKTKKYLQELVDYYNTTEGIEILRELGISEPEHIDDIINWVRDAIDSRELKNEIFRYKMKTNLKF